MHLGKIYGFFILPYSCLFINNFAYQTTCRQISRKTCLCTPIPPQNSNYLQHYSISSATKKLMMDNAALCTYPSTADQENMNLSYDKCGNHSISNSCYQQAQDVFLIACGSFNPVTTVHLRMFEDAKDFLHKNHPHYRVKGGYLSPVSDGYGKAELANVTHRKEMCKLATANSSWIKVLDWEGDQESWTPTVTVLEHYEKFLNKTRNSNAKIMLLCGTDLLSSFLIKDMWLDCDVRTILQHFGLIVETRPSDEPYDMIQKSDLLFELQKEIYIVPPLIVNDLSSTKVRTAIRSKQSIKYLTPDPVMDYIYEHHLYKSNPSAPLQDLAPLRLHQQKL